MSEDVEVLDGVHSFEVNGQKYVCEVVCKDCPFLNRCKNIESEELSYRINSRIIGSELAKSSAIFPSLILESDDKIRKLYSVIIELFINSKFGRKWNALDIAKNLRIPVYKVRSRLDFLVRQKFLVEKQTGHYQLTLNKTVNELVTFYCENFKKRFGNGPRVTNRDADVINQLMKEYPRDIVERLIKAYVWSQDDYLNKCGYPLSLMSQRVNRLLIDINKLYVNAR